MVIRIDDNEFCWSFNGDNIYYIDFGFNRSKYTYI